MRHLPPSLAPWADQLTQLDPALASSLGPMIHVLEELVGRLDSHRGSLGQLDGYDGMTTRGHPDRMLISEWLLADEAPLEFLRRAAESELLYLAPAHRHERSQGRVVAVVDSGPEQLGAGRLVQLAALVVLDRRAQLSGSELAVIDAQSGLLTTGPLHVPLPPWLRSRSPRAPRPDEVAGCLAGLPHEDRAWLLCGDATATLLPGHRRKVVSEVATWRAGGAAEVRLRVGDASTRVALPASGPAVAALRGEGLTRQRARGPDVESPVIATGRGAVFTSEEPQLLWRGGSAGELCTVRCGPDASARVRLHRLPGHILGAAALGRRIVTVLTDGQRIRVHVKGRDLARVQEIDLPVADLDLSSADIDEICAAPIRPVYFVQGGLLVPIRDRWWEIDRDGAREASWLTVGPGSALDTPRRIARVADSGFQVAGRLFRVDPGGSFIGPVLGPDDHLAWSTNHRVWEVARSSGHREEPIAVGEGDLVVGMTRVNGMPALVTVTASGRIVRYATARHTKTWTAWAGPAHFDVHPTRPWLVRSTPSGVLVGDLQTGDVILDLKVAE